MGITGAVSAIRNPEAEGTGSLRVWKDVRSIQTHVATHPCASAFCASLVLVFWVTDICSVFCSDSGRGSSLLDRTIADRRQLNTITLPDFSDPETGENQRPEGVGSRAEGGSKYVRLSGPRVGWGVRGVGEECGGRPQANSCSLN